MAQTMILWTTLLVLAALAALATAWWGRRRFVRGRLAVIAVAAFLAVGAAGGFLARGPLTSQARQERANAHAAELFRTDALLRALAGAEPERSAALQSRLAQALAAGNEAQQAAVEERLRDEATAAALAAGLARLPNASDEAAARLAEALLAALKELQGTDALLCLGLLHPASQTEAALTANALARLRGEARKKLETALALTLTSSALKPQAAPSPARADAALADMFSEALPAFEEIYGSPREIQALFEALGGDAVLTGKIPPAALCAFAQDLLRALLRMPPEERGAGLRRLLGTS